MRKNRWQLQEAKARLSELVRAAQEYGPQEISVRGETAVVVIAKSSFDDLERSRPRFLEFIRASPLAGKPLKLVRDRTPARDIAL